MSKKEIVPEFPKELLKYSVVSIFLLIALLYLVLVVQIDLKVVGTLALFIVIGAVSRLPQRASPFSFGVELCTLVTISAAILYGPIAGLAVGVLSFGLAGFYTREGPQDTLIGVIGLALIGYFASSIYLYFGDLGMTALTITLVYDFGTNLAYMFMGHSIANCLRFSAMHVPSNYLILRYLGPKLIGL